MQECRRPQFDPWVRKIPWRGIGYPLQFYWASLVAQKVKNLPMVQETWVLSLGWEDPLEKEWLPTPVFLPGEFHGWRSLAGYSPWGHKEPEIEMEITTYITIRKMTFGINLRKNVQNWKVKPAKYVKRDKYINKWGKEKCKMLKNNIQLSKP